LIKFAFQDHVPVDDCHHPIHHLRLRNSGKKQDKHEMEASSH